MANRLAASLLLACAGLGGGPVPAAAQTSAPSDRARRPPAEAKRWPGERAPRVHRYRLDNGLTLLVQVDRRLPLAHVTCMYRVGSANERPGTTGLAHYVEHMAFRSTENVSMADLTGTVERIGGRWTGYTSLDQTRYGATVPVWALGEMLRIEAERMTRVRWDADEFERERTSVIAELQSYDGPASILRREVVASAFDNHPYRHPIVGWLSDILGVTVDEGERFYRDYYGPNNAVLVIVGDVDPDGVRRMVERHLGALRPAPRSADVRIAEPPRRGEKRVEVIGSGPSRHLVVAYPAPAVADADFPAFLLLDAVLTGGGGLEGAGGRAVAGSRLHRAASAAGAGASTGLSLTRYPYLYTVSSRVGGDATLDDVEAAVRGVLEGAARADFTEAELDEARDRIRTAIALETGDLGDAAHRLAFFELLGSWELADAIEAGIAATGPDDLRAVAGRWLQPHRVTVGHHRPGELDVPTPTVPEPRVPPRPPERPSPVPGRALEPLPRPELPAAARVLDNGVHLRAARSTGPTGAIHVRLGWGARLDPAGREGAAVLAGRLIGGADELRALARERGVRVDASADEPAAPANRDHLDLTLRFVVDDLDAVLDAVGRALAVRSFPAKRVADARESLRSSVESIALGARSAARLAALERVDPAWRSPAGTPASVARITARDVADFLARHHGGGAVYVGLAVPGDPEAVLKRTAAALASIPAGAPSAAAGRRTSTGGAGTALDARHTRGDATPTGATVPNAHVSTSANANTGASAAASGVPAASRGGTNAARRAADPDPVLIPVEGATQAAIVAALPGVGRDHPDHLPLRLLNYVIGETGYAGRLGAALVDTGLAYSVYAVPSFGRTPGPLLIRTATATSTLERTLDVIRRELEGLHRDGPEDWELREAQGYAIGSMLRALETDRSLARTLAEGLHYGVDPLDLTARSREVLAVEPDAVAAAARRHYRPEALVLVAAGAVAAATVR